MRGSMRKVPAGPCRGMCTYMVPGDIFIVIKQKYWAGHARVLKGRTGYWLEWRKGFGNEWTTTGTFHHDLYDAIYKRVQELVGNGTEHDGGEDSPQDEEVPEGSGVRGESLGLA